MSDLFDLHEGAERHLKVSGNLPKHLARALLDENKRLQEQVTYLGGHDRTGVDHMEEMWETAALADELYASIVEANMVQTERTEAAMKAWETRGRDGREEQ